MPRLARGRKPRTKTTGFGVTDDELQTLHTKAAVAGYANLGAWIRDVIFAAEITPPPAQIDQDTNNQLRGIGANLNQALRRINGGMGNGDDWDVIRDASRSVIVLRRKLIGHDPGVPLSDAQAGIPAKIEPVTTPKSKALQQPGTWQVS
jgi:hypothetical protein